jgi:hypothetical protein
VTSHCVPFVVVCIDSIVIMLVAFIYMFLCVCVYAVDAVDDDVSVVYAMQPR